VSKGVVINEPFLIALGNETAEDMGDNETVTVGSVIARMFMEGSYIYVCAAVP
jgi:hypothetical protein